MYSYRFDNKTQGYLLTTQTGKYVANEIRPVFAPELALTGLGKYFEYDPNETRPLMWGIKNTYLIADVDENGNAYGRKVAQLNGTQYGRPLSIQTFFDGKLPLTPVDVDAMVAANAEIMDIVVADAKRRTKELYDESIYRVLRWKGFSCSARYLSPGSATFRACGFQRHRYGASGHL